MGSTLQGQAAFEALMQETHNFNTNADSGRFQSNLLFGTTHHHPSGSSPDIPLHFGPPDTNEYERLKKAKLRKQS